MNIFLRIHDRLTGVLGRDCEGKAVRKGDLVEPSPLLRSAEIPPAARCLLIADRHPKESDLTGSRFSFVLFCLNPYGQEIRVRDWIAIRKVPQSEQDARWENVERMTGWKPRTVKQDEGVTS